MEAFADMIFVSHLHCAKSDSDHIFQVLTKILNKIKPHKLSTFANVHSTFFVIK